MPIELCEQERVELERRASMVTLPFRTVQRARMILYAAEGMQDIDIAARLDCSVDSVARRRSRFRAERLDGLEDQPRSGRPRRFPPEQVAEVKAIACDLPRTHELPLSRFSRVELHRLVIERGVTEASASTIWRWLHEDAIKPWQTRSWIFSRDPEFAQKAGRVLDLHARTFDGKRLRPDEYVISAMRRPSCKLSDASIPRSHPAQAAQDWLSSNICAAGRWPTSRPGTCTTPSCLTVPRTRPGWCRSVASSIRS
ncbi:MAG: helix-turn-helix domain-containing protein [Solirubrobacteraceae bacterium]